MPAERLDLITVDFRQDESGWFFATSPDCPGLFVCDPDKGRVVTLVPQAIELLYEARWHRHVKAVPLHHPIEKKEGDLPSLPFAAIPTGMLAEEGVA